MDRTVYVVEVDLMAPIILTLALDGGEYKEDINKILGTCVAVSLRTWPLMAPIAAVINMALKIW
jgi:hypothetical protein